MCTYRNVNVCMYRYSNKVETKIATRNIRTDIITHANYAIYAQNETETVINHIYRLYNGQHTRYFSLH